MSKGWTGRILRVDLSRMEVKVWNYPSDLAYNYIGGRGFAIKILWDELKPGTDPLSPGNILIFAAGPLTGLVLPCSGKMVVASKSPLTGGYGDGNVGSWAAVQMRKAGFDAVVITGASKKPIYLYIEDDKVEFNSADNLWGKDTFTVERRLREIYGKDVGILTIGPAGENLVKYATIMSQEGRSGGRPGLGAVMGSKKLKAVVFKGTKDIPVDSPEELKRLGGEGYTSLKSRSGYDFWVRQGTMMTIEWAQRVSVLPTYNFREGVFEYADRIDGFTMEKIKIAQKCCPYCGMPCGNVVRDAEGKASELDYENVAMLGSNIGLGDLGRVAVLNRLADMYGVDTISLGSTIAFFMEACEKKIVKDYTLEWGDFKKTVELIHDIVYRRGIGSLLAEGVREASRRLGGNSWKWAMHVKGLEISAYNCHAAPGMALAFSTSPIGAHHKDAWVILWEISYGRYKIAKDKVLKVIEFQRIRGGIFETLVVCRLPWIELGFELDWYLKYFKLATGYTITLNDYYTIGDRIYSLIRAFWIREYHGNWGRHMDIPPARWFEEPLTKGPLKGSKLSMEGYNQLLSWYYEVRGWDERGVPRKRTLEKLGLSFVISELEKYITLNQ